MWYNSSSIGVRGTVAGDVVRRLVARTISQQLGPEVEQATSPYQYAMSTRARCECVAHALQGLTELDQNATVTSVDVISAFDMISRQASWKHRPPFRPLVLWAGGSVMMVRSTTSPRAKGEQGDAMMPLLYSLGQHRLQEGEHLFAYLDATFFVSSPLRVGPLYAVLQEALNVHAGIQMNAGKTQIWNRCGERPEVCNVLERVARASNHRAIVWRGSQLPSEMQGIKMLGTPLGHPDFVARHLEGVLEEQRVFLSRIPLVNDIQSAWLLLLHCANARANYQIRSVTPEGVETYAQAHDDRIWQCFCELLKWDPAHDGREIAN